MIVSTGPAKKQSDAKKRPPRPSELYAALDLGTNNCRMLIARRTPGGFRVVDSFSRITRLGEDITSTGLLNDDAMERTIRALKVCAKKIESRDVSFIRGVATEACRRAANAPDFIEKAKLETGINLQAISPEEEARLALSGCASLLTPTNPNALVFDIGGGSTEVMWIELGRFGDPIVVDVISLPIGVVTVAESYGSGEDIDKVSYCKIVEDVRAQLVDFDARNSISSAIESNRVQMLGTSGTVTTLGAVSLNLPRYLRSKVDGMSIQFEQVRSISQDLAEMNCEERAAHPCIGESRADLVVGGCAILEALCDLWPVGQLKIADRGIREGLLLEMMQK